MSSTIIWVGPLLDSESMRNKKAVSPAANVWQANFITGLQSNNYKILSISYLPEPTWPRGPFYVQHHKALPSNELFEQKSIGYFNVLMLREISIAIVVLWQIFLIRNREVHTIFTYNPMLRNVLIGTLIKTFTNIKWISVVADDVKKGSPDFDLFLSFNYFETSKQLNKIFCDGGVPQMEIKSQELLKTKKSLVYSGSINKWTGIFEFVTAFGSLNSKNFHLDIYGKGEVGRLKQFISSNKYQNISVHGFVSDEILNDALLNAYAFVNPRNTTLKNSENNFPSKLLLYLSYEKPIIATFSPGLSPEIRKVLLEYVDLESFKAQLTSLKNDHFYNDTVSQIRVYKNENSWKSKTQSVMDKITGS